MASTVVCYQNSLDKNRRGTSANLPTAMVGSAARRVTATASSSRDQDGSRIGLNFRHLGCGLRSYDKSGRSSAHIDSGL